MRLLLINPNTSQFVTDTVKAEALQVCDPDTQIDAVTGRFGPAIIGSRSENVIGAYSALSLAAEHGRDADAIVLAVSFDSGLPGVREAMSVPVVGMMEAACLAACMLGGTFALMTFGDRAGPIYSELVEHYGLGQRFHGVHSLGTLSPEEMRNTELIADRVIDGATALAGEGVEAVVLAGAVFAGLARNIGDSTPIPLVDGIAAGVKMAEMLVQLACSKPTRGSYRLPEAKDLTRVESGLEKLFKSFPR